MTGATSGRCPACGAPLQLVWVHGHGQCAACGQNVAPCCSGAGDEVDARESSAGSGGVQAVLEILTEQGATLRATLLNRFAERTGCGLDVGEQAVVAAERCGRIRVDHSTGIVELAS